MNRGRSWRGGNRIKDIEAEVQREMDEKRNK